MVAKGSAKLRFFSIYLSQRVAFKFQPNSICCEAVYDGISQSRFIDVVMPFGDRQLRSNDDGLSLEAVLKYLEQSQPRVVVEGLQSEVIKDDEVIPLERYVTFIKLTNYCYFAILSIISNSLYICEYDLYTSGSCFRNSSSSRERAIAFSISPFSFKSR